MVNLATLRKLREAKQLSCTDIALILGFKTAQGYYYKEKGKSRITANELKALADFYEISIGELFDNVQNI